MGEIDITKDSENRAIIYDLIQGDTKLWSRLEGLDLEKIQRALDLIVNNEKLPEATKLDLISNSWRITYKQKPPTISEFLNDPKYLGRLQEHIYPRVKNVLTNFFDESKPYRNLIMYFSIGWGKEGRLDTKIFTPNGYKLMGEIKIGDIVSTPDGKTSRVIGIFPQGVKDIYEVTFKDGRKTWVGAEHLWKVTNCLWVQEWSKEKKKYISVQKTSWQIKTTRELMKSGLYWIHSGAPKWKIPLTSPVYHEKKEHYISPYFLGALLGDGCVSNTKHVVQFTNSDKEIIDNMILECPANHSISPQKNPIQFTIIGKGNIKKELDRLQLLGKKSGTKFIPQEYLFDSVENRIALLQGLMDTDGTVDRRGSIGFSTTSVQLKDDICFLVRGLGGLASWKPHMRKNRICNTEYNIFIQFPNNNFSIFRLKRKQERVNANFNRVRKRRNTQNLSILSIEKIDPAEAQCILLDSTEHLYLTDDYIVTHNSTAVSLINLYTMMNLALMRNPKKYFNLAPTSTLCFLYCSYNLKKSAEVLLEPTRNILESSEFFERVRTKEDMIKKEQEYQENNGEINRIFWTTSSIQGVSAIQFSNNLHLKLASTPSQILGLTIVLGSFTEISFFFENGKSPEYVMRFFNDMKSRVESRMKGNYWGRTILDSSPNDANSPIDHYCMYEAQKDPLNYIVKGGRYEWAPEDFKNIDDRFPIFRGGEGKPPVILNSTEGYEPDDLIWVPKELYQFYHDDLIKSLKDISGIPQGNLDKIFHDYSKIENIFIDKMRTIEMAIKADAKVSPYGLIWNQVKNTFFNKVGDSYRFYYKPTLPRCFHIDQSITGDMTGIAFSHIERKNVENFNIERDLVYVVDMIIPVHPFGGRINLEAIAEFIIDCQTKGGLGVIKGSFDIFQSEASIQHLERYGIETEHLSVDDTMDPYLFLFNLIEQGNLKCGKNIFLKNNLKSLRITQTPRSKKLKIDHTSGDIVNPSSNMDINWSTSLLGLNAKDISDCVCGSIYNCHKNLMGEALSQIWNEESIIVTPEMLKKKTLSLVRDMGFGF